MSEEVKEAIKLFDREDLLGEYGIQDTDTNIEVFMSIKDMVKYYRQDLEIERLNNIINELEKYINGTKLEEFEKVYGRRYGKTFTQAEIIICNMILNKLQELKGVDKE